MLGRDWADDRWRDPTDVRCFSLLHKRECYLFLSLTAIRTQIVQIPFRHVDEGNN